MTRNYANHILQWGYTNNDATVLFESTHIDHYSFRIGYQKFSLFFWGPLQYQSMFNYLFLYLRVKIGDSVGKKVIKSREIGEENVKIEL